MMRNIIEHRVCVTKWARFRGLVSFELGSSSNPLSLPGKACTELGEGRESGQPIAHLDVGDLRPGAGWAVLN
jgi:hypothetical protein